METTICPLTGQPVEQTGRRGHPRKFVNDDARRYNAAMNDLHRYLERIKPLMDDTHRRMCAASFTRIQREATEGLGWPDIVIEIAAAQLEAQRWAMCPEERKRIGAKLRGLANRIANKRKGER